jgi:hypothetical protein
MRGLYPADSLTNDNRIKVFETSTFARVAGGARGEMPGGALMGYPAAALACPANDGPRMRWGRMPKRLPCRSRQLERFRAGRATLIVAAHLKEVVRLALGPVIGCAKGFGGARRSAAQYYLQEMCYE